MSTRFGSRACRKTSSYAARFELLAVTDIDALGMAYHPAMTDQLPPNGEIKDFSLPMEPKRFRIGDDVFSAPAIISPVTLQRVAKMRGDLEAARAAAGNDEQQIAASLGAMAGIFELLMPGESGARMKARIYSDGTDPNTPPVDLQRQVAPALFWLMEEYGLRPTQQSSSLPAGSTTGDSMDGALAELSTGEQ